MDSRTVSPVFVGRAPECAALDEGLAAADAGGPQAVLVGGEAGVGKTRLVEEFLRRAEAAGAVTAVGACVEVGADGLPFAPVSTILRALYRRLGEELTRAAAGFGGELARLLPELGEPSAAVGAARDVEVRGRLFELTGRLLEALARERALALVIEDLHWSDTSTRELLGYLFRSLQSGRVMLVATYRSDDIHRRHPLRPFLAELDRLRTVRRFELARFTRDEVRSQLAGIRGSRPPEDLLDDVYQRSDGNAFFVEELAGMSEECGSGGITDSVRDLLLVRVEALPETAQRVVRLVARGGSQVEYGLLRAVAELCEDDLIAALRAAVGASVLLAQDDGTYRFRHALAREAVDDDLLPGERSRLSRRYAEALEADPALVPPDGRAARLATFWYHAHDPVKALPAVVGAASGARGQHAYAEQLQLLERALELWDAVPLEVRQSLRVAEDADSYPLCDCPDEALGLLDMLAAMTLAARYAGVPERGLSLAKRALRALDGLGHPLRAAWFWVEKSRFVRNLGRGSGREELDTAQELLRGIDASPVHARVLTEAALWGAVFAPGPDSLAVAGRAVVLARTVGDRIAELNALLSRGGLLIESGRGEEGLHDLRTVAEQAVASDLVGVFTRSHINLQSLLESMGRSEESLAVAEEGLALAYHYGLPDTQAWLQGNRSDALFSLGRWDEAEEAARSARRSGQMPVTRALAAQRLARLALARGDLAVAEAEITTLRGLHRLHNGAAAQYAHPVAEYRIALAAHQGRILDARRLWAEAVSTGLGNGTGSYTWPMVAAAAEAESAARGVPAALPGQAESLAALRDYAAGLRRDYPVWAAYAALVEAELRRAEGAGGAAEWAAVAGMFDGLGRPFELARVHQRWAEALLAEGQRERAGELLVRAHEAATALGAGLLVAGTGQLARRARLPLTREESVPGAGGGAESFGLTRRERDVLTLVAAGRSNRQIAEELFISPKTASVHVSHILAKLEVSGRGEAAALAHRLGIVGAEPVAPAG
ncbi:helix-turn-helix transcriptional regulator [Streptomyces marincola]|uniref:helix-turn-helix transcriptional regulator n=1 Tax=Streptomyces marincola TaxID=2878388 RepID=UPI001CF5E210|nr:helix-turn-helix transcriptional regulator [Streptomyces marincola]UCM90655.1 AAA family ATPase [Streptomyces marincola]